MTLTANSNNNNANKQHNTAAKIIKFPSTIFSLSNLNNKCPAIILAANRIASVNGRIILLINSISTIKGISTLGVLKGTKWANDTSKFCEKAINICPTHKGKANDNVKTPCEDEVKI